MYKFKLILIAILFINFNNAYGASESNIVILGDSLSAAYGIPIEKGWVSLLQERLNKENYPYKLVNASISGETTSGALVRLDKLLREFSPAIVVIELGANDGLRGLSLKEMSENIELIISKTKQAQAIPFLIGIKIPPNYGPIYSEAFYDVYNTLTEKYKTPFLPFLFSGLKDSNIHFQEDDLHPNELAQPILMDNVYTQLAPLLKKH